MDFKDRNVYIKDVVLYAWFELKTKTPNIDMTRTIVAFICIRIELSTLQG